MDTKGNLEAPITGSIIFVYVDDVLVGSEHPGRMMEEIKTALIIKPGSLKEPDFIWEQIKALYS